MRTGPFRVTIWLLALASCVAGLRVSLELTHIHLQEAEGYVLTRAPGIWGLIGLRDIQSRRPVDSAVAANESKEESENWLDSMCSATQTASCEEVAKSEYSVFPFRAGPGQFQIPVALLGMFYFTLALVWLVLIGLCSPSRWWMHLIFVGGTAIGVGVSAFFEYVMWANMDHWCPLCVIAHALSLLLLVFALLMWPRASAEGGGRGQPYPTASRFVQAGPDWPPKRMLLVMPCVAVVLLLGEFLGLSPENIGSASSAASRPAGGTAIDEKAMMANLTSQPADALARQIVDLRTKLDKSELAEKYYKRQVGFYEKHWLYALTSWRLSPPVQIDIANRPFRGPANAPHTMVIYSDFQCPGCKKFEEFVNKKLIPLSERNGGLVRIVFKYWPICTDCNPYATRDLHPASCMAALAAEASLMVGGDEAYWKMYDLLWETQPRWKGWKNNRDFDALASEIGLDVQAFEQAMDSEEAMAQVKADIEEGANLGKGLPNVKPDDLDFIKVNSTPSVFVDNKRLWKLHPSESLWLTIFRMPPMAPRTSRTTSPAASPEAESTGNQ